MSHPIPTTNAAEVDAFSKMRHMLIWSPGERKAIKNGYNRRVRRAGKAEIRRETW